MYSHGVTAMGVQNKEKERRRNGVIFVGYVNPENNGASRRIRRLFNEVQVKDDNATETLQEDPWAFCFDTDDGDEPTKYPEWLTVSSELDDNAVETLQEGLWIFRTEDNKECVPVRFLCDEGDVHCYRYLWETLDNIFGKGSTEEDDLIEVKERIVRWSGCTNEDVFTWVKEQLLAGNISTDDLGKWLNADVLED